MKITRNLDTVSNNVNVRDTKSNPGGSAKVRLNKSDKHIHLFGLCRILQDFWLHFMSSYLVVPTQISQPTTR